MNIFKKINIYQNSINYILYILYILYISYMLYFLYFYIYIYTRIHRVGLGSRKEHALRLILAKAPARGAEA